MNALWKKRAWPQRGFILGHAYRTQAFLISQLIENIHAVEGLTSKLSKSLIANNGESEVFQYESDQQVLFDNSLALIASSYNSFQYKDGQHPNETTHFYGVAAIDKDTLEIAMKLNSVKAELREMYSKVNFRKYKKRKQEFNNLLSIKRFSAKQTYRQIPLVEEGADLVSFSHCHTKSIKSITWQQAYDMIAALGEGGKIDADIQYLMANTNKQFAVVRKSPQHMRANIRVGGIDNATRYQIKCSTPLLVYAPSNRLPKIKKPFLEGFEKSKRKNEYLSDKAVLQSINAFEI